ncbi:MAG: hypothetical protein IIA17_04890 [candidate division Zixibacteria bacterium]|nr:hypothetical protein [candidate division Zixibacteria bacterium]
MANINSAEKLASRLKNILIKQRLTLFGSGLLVTGAAVLAAWFVLSLLAAVFILPVWLKISLLTISGASAIYFFSKFAVTRLFNGDIDSVAVNLEEKYPDLKGRLIAAIQFSRSTKPVGYSPELIDLTLVQALQKSGSVNFNDALTFGSVLKTGRTFGVAAIFSIAVLFIFPGFFGYSLEVYSNPTAVVAPPLGYQLSAFPGSTEWVKYRDIEIGGFLSGDGFPKTAKVFHRFTGGSWQSSEIDIRKIRRGQTDFGDSLSFSVKLRQVNRSFDYYVQAGRTKTDIQKVDVVDKPRVNGIKLSIFYPDYTGLEPTVIDENNGSFSAVTGSRVNIKTSSNLAVEKVEMVFDNESRLPMKVSGKVAEASLVVENSQSYYFRLTDHLGEENPDPIQYYVTAVPDEFPSISLLRPGFDVNLTDEMVLPLKVRIFDDYGFSSLVLKFTTVYRGNPSEEHVAVIHFPERIKTEGEIEFNWDMDQLNMFPGDYCLYHFEVADNDKISGPKVSKTRQYVARLPSLDEIISQSEQETSRRVTNTENLLRQGREMAAKLKDAARKIRAQQKNVNKADWQQQKELEGIVDKNAQMADEIEKSAEEMEKAIEKMAENALLSRAILEKMQQIQKLFEEVATPEMKKAQQRLLEALKNMDQNEIQKAMEDYQLSQEEMLDRLERTLALLKKMQVMQKMEAMMRKAEELADRQEEMNKETESSDKDKLSDLSKTEDELKTELEKLQKEVAELNKLADEAKMQDSKELQKFAQALEKTDAGENMQQMSDALNQKKKKKASSQGKKAESKLRAMVSQMQQMFSQMQGDDSEKIKQQMRAALDDTNYLSKNQEALMQQSALMQQQSSLKREMAQQQQELAKSCNGLKNRIAELGKQSPFVAAELNAIVEAATQNMQLAVDGFGENRSQALAKRNQLEAMAGLNKASLRLMESLDQQSQCDNASNCSNGMKQLEKMSNEQNKLNQQTQNSCNNPGGNNPRMGQGDQRESFERLAGEQAALRKSLEQLAQEFGNSRQILGRLSDIAKEMREVEEALIEGEVGSETTERQLKIYSRLLEASRSLQRRDFTEQRKANTASQAATYLPPALSSDILNDKSSLEDRLREYLGGNYPVQYEEQIKAYFKALLQIQSGGRVNQINSQN